MKKIIFAALLTGAASTATAAPLIDLYGGVYTWNAKPSGSIASHGEGKVDFKDDLNFGSDNTMVMYLGLEHFVPLVPNVRLRSEERRVGKERRSRCSPAQYKKIERQIAEATESAKCTSCVS